MFGRVFLGPPVPDAADSVVPSSRAYYDWGTFVPQRESDIGVMTKYFGKVASNDEESPRDRVARTDEEIGTYDATYYETHNWSELSRACCHRSGGDRQTFDENSQGKNTVLSSFGSVDELS